MNAWQKNMQSLRPRISRRHAENAVMSMSTIRIAAVSLILSLWGAMAYAGVHHYYYTDPQGTVLAKADASGAIIATYDYAPYGTAVASMSPAPNGPGYTGHVNDPESGLVYMQARYYDPGRGGFLSVDPVGPTPENTFNFNRYAYANGNPIVNIDADGRETGIAFQAINRGAKYPQIEPQTTVERAIALGPIALLSIPLAAVSPEGAGLVRLAVRSNFKSAENAPRPKGVPKSWVSDKPKGGPGTMYRNPENPQHDTVRAVPGRPENSQPGQQVDHVVRTANGKRYGEANTPVPRNSQESHVPAEKFQFVPANKLPKN